MTHQAVLDAARALFIDRGYVATTIEAIAARAQVSAETVYAAFGSKRALLSTLVDVSIAGSANAPPVLEQSWVAEMRMEPEARRRLEILARNGQAILERRWLLDEVLRGAAGADPEIAALWERSRGQRHAGQRELLRLVVGEGLLREGLDVETAADILYALGSPETYGLLVGDCGWTGAKFARWYGETLERLFFDPGEIGGGTP